MNKNTKQIKRFIKEFNFAYPNFSSLPEDFPNCDTKNLSKEEKHLFDAIKTTWFFAQPNALDSLHALFINGYHPEIILNSKLVGGATAFISISTFIFGAICITYYANIEFNLGLHFLTNFFA